MNHRKTVTVRTEDDNALRMTLPAPCWTGWDKMGPGYHLKAIHVGPRSKRVVRLTHSAWQDRNGECTGDRYHLVEDPAEIARLAENYPKVASALDAAGICPPEDL